MWRSAARTARLLSKQGPSGKLAVLALLERGGSVRSFHVPTMTGDEVTRIVRENVSLESALHTDESNLYKGLGKEFTAHETVKH
jgi:ISXO2-like transposase domain